MILLWGLAGDPVLRSLSAELDRLGASVFFLDQRAAPESTLRLRVDGAVGGVLESQGRRIELEAVTAVYLRPHDTRRLAALDPARSSRDWIGAAAFDQGLLAWLELTPALVVNRPSAMSVNGSKPLQSAEIAAAGFHVPETLVTTEPEAALAFWRRHGEVVYKSVSGVRSRVARLEPAHAGRLAEIAWCPTQFQRYVAGREFRAHVVGDEVLACEVVSDADDYRHAADGRSADIVAADLPPGVAARCRRMTRAMDLYVAGLDLRLADDGSWYCFEANPSPGFTFYEDEAGQPIAAAVACLLAGIRVAEKRDVGGPRRHARVPPRLPA